jgi:hypothetical protein
MRHHTGIGRIRQRGYSLTYSCLNTRQPMKVGSFYVVYTLTVSIEVILETWIITQLSFQQLKIYINDIFDL